jgi:hypothetical protein
MPARRTAAFWYLAGGAVFLLAGGRVLVVDYFTTARGWPDLLSAWFALAGVVMLTRGIREYRSIRPATPLPELSEPVEARVAPPVPEVIPPPAAPGLVRWLVVLLVGLAVVATVVALVSG